MDTGGYGSSTSGSSGGMIGGFIGSLISGKAGSGSSSSQSLTKIVPNLLNLLKKRSQQSAGNLKMATGGGTPQSAMQLKRQAASQSVKSIPSVLDILKKQPGMVGTADLTSKLLTGKPVVDYTRDLHSAYGNASKKGEGFLGKPLYGSMGTGSKMMTDIGNRLSGNPIGDPFNAWKTPALFSMGMATGKKPSSKGLNINKNLTPGKETTLDAIPHTLKAGSQVAPKQIDYFLSEYSNRPMVGATVKKFLAGNPTPQQKIDFILNNF